MEERESVKKAMSTQASVNDLNSKLDAILWNPAATNAAVESLCAFAMQHKLRAVCVNSSRLAAAAARLEESDVRTVALVGFPLGAMDADAKRYETELAFDLGANEVEVVLSLGQIKDGDSKRMLRELRDLVAAAEERPLAVTIELARLTRDELGLVGEVIQESGVRRICTSTDFWPDSSVTVDALKQLREVVGEKVQLKAVGGIREPPLAHALLGSGAVLVGSANVVALIG